MTKRSFILRRDGVCVILAAAEGDLPAVVFWGKDLGELNDTQLNSVNALTLRQTPPATLDSAWRPSLLPMGREGWAGRPALQASEDTHPLFPVWNDIRTTVSPDGFSLTVHARGMNEIDGVHIGLTLNLELAQGGLLVVRNSVTNEGSDHGIPVDLEWLDACLPVPKSATTMTSFTGRWPLEKSPLTTELPDGSLTRTSRRGKPGHDSPWIVMLSDGRPRNGSGSIWAVHLAWSGDASYRTDRLPHHQPMLGAGELLGPSEIRLEVGETYSTPEVCFAFSDNGLDGISDRYHAFLRGMKGRATTPRPFTLNTWEAVYFDHSWEVLRTLAARAAQVGVERFVLDDGWFHERRDDTKGLGDWVVDPEVWPQGLKPLADYVHNAGMQFGLWFEPEMVNLDSDVGRNHPEWILAYPSNVPNRPDISYRSQYVLDLANPHAYEHVRSQMTELIAGLGIDYIKWDHNRELTEPIHDGRYGTHSQTLAVYRLIDALKAQFPGLEIESCSSGGARTDIGILERTDRIWASDSNDPRNRNDIQRWTELIVPPEMIGAHIGPSPAHSTGRSSDLSYRAAISLEGCSGLEWNILECSDAEIAQVTSIVSLYKELRGLLHTGLVRHADMKDPAVRARYVVDQSRTHAIVTVSTVDDMRDALGEMLKLPELADDREYSVRLRTEIGETKWGWTTPLWLTQAASEGGVVVSGKLLRGVGLLLPCLWPQQAFILEVKGI
ncbi:MAG: alpha-galactosidase [Bifidobacteriaceae bacterium]|jgi:alpha-galactosidase|nr:alpha-galactosidase [Bifidobacteriaceae bacterium]